MTSSCILISRHDHVLSFISIYFTGETILDNIYFTGETILDNIYVTGETILDNIYFTGEIILDNIYFTGETIMDNIYPNKPLSYSVYSAKFPQLEHA